MGNLWSQPWSLAVCRSRRGGGPRKEEKQPLVNVGVRQRCFGKPGSISVRKEHEFLILGQAQDED